MKTVPLIKRCSAIVFVLIIFTLIAFGETSPFKSGATLLKEHVPAGELIPVAVNFTIAPNHHIYKDQVKIESGDIVKQIRFSKFARQ